MCLHISHILLGAEQRAELFREAAKKAPGSHHINTNTSVVANPQTTWGISILYGIIGFVSWSGLASLIGRFSSSPARDNRLPSYEF